MVLSLVPVVVWVFALTLLTRDTSSPYKLELPSNYNWSSENQYRTEYLLSTILSMVTSILVPLILVSATESHDRIMFFGLMKGLAVFFAVIRFGLEMLRGLPNKQFFTFINPLPFIFEAIGSFMVVIALLRLGKSSIPAIAIFLFLFWLVQLMGHTFDSLAIGVGSIGGGIAVWGLMLLHEANERLKKVTI